MRGHAHGNANILGNICKPSNMRCTAAISCLYWGGVLSRAACRSLEKEAQSNERQLRPFGTSLERAQKKEAEASQKVLLHSFYSADCGRDYLHAAPCWSCVLSPPQRCCVALYTCSPECMMPLHSIAVLTCECTG